MSDLLIATSEAQVRLCQNLQDQPLGRAAWNRLLEKSETHSIFLTWQWLATWWDCFKDGADLYTFAVLRDDTLIGVAPFRLCREGSERIVEFLGMGSSDYCDVIASPEDKPLVLQEVMQALLRRRDRWDRIRLRYLPEHSSTAALLSQMELPVGLEFHAEEEAVCPALSIETSPPFALACTKKKSLVRHTRYFERLAPIEFRHILDLDEIVDLLPEFMEQHRDRRFMAGDRSLFDDPRHKKFYERMAKELLDTGWLRFTMLRWQGEALAFHLGFVFNRVFTWYKPTFNVDFARYSPGEVLLKKLLEDCLEEDLREFDFTVGNEGFKDRFANVKRANLRVEIVQSRRQPLSNKVRRRVQRHVKENHPTLFARIKGIAQRLGAHPAESAAVNEAPKRRPRRLGITQQVLWRAAPIAAVPSEFRAAWARYSQIKEIARREGLKPDFLIQALRNMRNGQRAVVASWHDRPVGLMWLSRDPQAALIEHGFDVQLPEKAGLIADSYLAADVRASQKKDLLLPTIMTFLAAEGVRGLYRVEGPDDSPSLPQLCGAAVEKIARHTEIALLFRRLRSQKVFLEVDTLEQQNMEDEDARLGTD